MPKIWGGENWNRSDPTQVPTSGRGQPSPRLWVPNPHTLIPKEKSGMPTTKDECYEYNIQRSKADSGGTNLSNEWEFQLPRVLGRRTSASLTEHPEFLTLPGSVRIYYRTWAWKRLTSLLTVVRLSILRIRTGDPDHGKYRSILTETLSPFWDRKLMFHFTPVIIYK